jgi:hypothetical protein
VQLSDRTFRVWQELLDAANEQKIRGRFDSYSAAAAIIRRKPAEVRLVAAAGLLDESADGVWLHDWKDWQRWKPEDEGLTNDEPTSPEDPDYDSPITHESHRNGSGITHEKHRKTRSLARAREDVDVEGDVDVERERDTRSSPSLRSGAAASEKRGNPRVQAVIEAFRALSGDVYLTPRDHAAIKRSDVPPELIAQTYDAVARGAWGDDFMRKRLSVHEAIEWANAYQARETGDDGPFEGDCLCAELRERLTRYPNAYSYCSVHGDVRELA